MMNRRARQLGLADTNFVRPDGLDAAGHVSSARDVTKLARILMQKRVVRQIVAMRDATIEGGRRLHTWNDLLGNFPGVIGVKTGHTTAAGWSEVAAVRGPGRDRLRDRDRQPGAFDPKRRPRRADEVGARAVPRRLR